MNAVKRKATKHIKNMDMAGHELRVSVINETRYQYPC